MSELVAVVDYGMGNLHSVGSALEHVAPDSTQIQVTADASVIADADRVVLPGVGAIRDCVAELKGKGLEPIIRKAAAEKPFLGICVGLQMLLDHSEENDGVEGLGLFSGNVVRFPTGMRDSNDRKLKVPHMGWNNVDWQLDHPLTDGVDSGSFFYFVHSYYVQAKVSQEVLGRANHGVDIDAVLVRGNVAGVQFHPEKSSKTGLKLLSNFLRWQPETGVAV